MKRATFALGCLILLLFLGFFVSTSAEQRLQIEYSEPRIPSDLEHFYRPPEASKAFGLLRDGETEIDLHAYYRQSHRQGWDRAVYELDHDLPRSIHSPEEVDVDLMILGVEAYWLGYEDAYSKFEANRQGLER